MANYQHQDHIQQRRFAISRIPQVAYSSPSVPLSTSVPTLNEFIVTDKSLAKATVKTYDNKDMSTGVDIAATEQWIDSLDVTVDHSFQTSFEQLPRVLLLAMGGYSVTGSVAPFTHTFTPQDVAGSAGRQYPSTTYVEQTQGGLSTSAPGLDRYFPGCVCEKFSIKGDAVSRLEGSFTLRGSGRYITPSGVVFPPLASPNVNAMVNLNYPFNSQAVLTISDYSTLANPTVYGPTFRLNSWSIDVENSVLADDGYRPGAAKFNTITTPGVQQVETLTVAVTSVTSGAKTVTVTAAGMSNSPKAVTFTTVGSETANATAVIERAALAADPDVSQWFTVGGAAAAVILTARNAAANDSTMTVVNTASGGVSAATSAHTTPGTAEVSDATSGSVRSECLVGARMYTANFEVRVGVESGALAALRSQKPLAFALSCVGGSLGSGTYSFAVNIGLFHYETIDVAEKNGIITLAIKCKILADATNNYTTLNFVVNNNTASYIV